MADVTKPAPVKFGEAEKAREVPTIKASAVQWQSEGFCWREAMVRLPNGMTLQDLNDHPGVWANVQQDPSKALRRFDAIRAVAFDEEFLIEAIVNHADSDKAVLAGIRKVDLPKRTVALFEDINFKIAWMGNGYGVVRKSDGVAMGGSTFSTPEGAKQALLQQYSTRRVA